MDPGLLEKICCPESHQFLAVARPELVQSLNDRVARGELRDRSGKLVVEKLESGLVRADGKYLYPVRQNIPILLIDEAIPLCDGSS